MTIDFNNNGKDDIEELLDDMHEKFDELGKDTKERAEGALKDVTVGLEEATGIDIDGDGVVGAPTDEA